MIDWNEFEKLTQKEISPYIEDGEYRKLLLRLMHSKSHDSDEFIISEAIQIYANIQDDKLKVRILELLKNTQF